LISYRVDSCFSVGIWGWGWIGMLIVDCYMDSCLPVGMLIWIVVVYYRDVDMDSCKLIVSGDMGDVDRDRGCLVVGIWVWVWIGMLIVIGIVVWLL